MLPRPRGILFSKISRATWLVGIVLLLAPAHLANQADHNIVCREDLSADRREVLATMLRKITGLPDLRFNNDGVLLQGSRTAIGGSESARQLLAKAVTGPNVVVIEDASNHADVAFCRVNSGRWKNSTADN